MAARQLDIGAARQRAIPANRLRQAVAQNFAVPCAADPVGQHSGKRQVRLEAGQPMGQRAEGLGHGRAVDHCQYRHAETPRQVAGAGVAIKQSHHAFDEDQVGFAGGLPQQPARLLLADHPQVELIDRPTAGAGENHRVEKVRPALEYPHAFALADMQPSQSGGDGGLALTGRGRGDQQCRAASAIHRGLAGRVESWWM